MVESAASLIERFSGYPAQRGEPLLRRLLLLAATVGFLLIGTAIVAYDALFGAQSGLSTLQIGDPAPTNIYATETRSYMSDVLTRQRREEARRSILDIYTPPDAAIARTQSALASRILEYIDNIRQDVYGSFEEKRRDIQSITALDLNDAAIDLIITMDDEKWRAIDSEVRALLEQVMQEAIREADLQGFIDRLPNQVSLRFNEQEVQVVVELVRDLVRPNRTVNSDATLAARDAAAASVPEQEVIFQRGQIIVSAGAVVDETVYEALTELGLLQPASLRFQSIIRALVAVLVVMIILGLYMMRYHVSLVQTETRLIVLMALIFLVALLTARLGIGGQIYLFASGVVGLLYAALVAPSIAVLASMGLAMLIGIMANDSLEVAVNVAVASMVGILTLRRPERLTSFFASGLLMSVGSIAVVIIFNIASPSETRAENIALAIMYALFSGIIAAAASILGLYLIGQVFNFATAVRLIELNQPSHPLLQRLLREAPGTYQHSLQVANLAEQAANVVGADAALVRVAALYHDIGKLLNPAFFVENQPELGSSPHDALNDPYASAAIIIDHVVRGAEMAKRNRLPRRIRDFILEHHGTTQVYVFYQRAIAQKGPDEPPVDPADFSYPGPKPQTRETAILLLADSSEASVRSMRPESREQIESIVDNIFEGKRKEGQLDECDITLKELSIVKTVFVDLLKAMYHPRINYQEALTLSRRPQDTSDSAAPQAVDATPAPRADVETQPINSVPAPPTGRNEPVKPASRSRSQTSRKSNA